MDFLLKFLYYIYIDIIYLKIKMMYIIFKNVHASRKSDFMYLVKTSDLYDNFLLNRGFKITNKNRFC